MAVVEKKPFTISHAGLHLLARCLADPALCTDPKKRVLFPKVWQKIRNSYPHVIGGHDIDDGQLAPKPEHYQTTRDGVQLNPQLWAEHAAAYTAAIKRWTEETGTVELSNRYAEACREALRHAMEKTDKAETKLPSAPHVAQLIIALGLADPEPDDE